MSNEAIKELTESDG